MSWQKVLTSRNGGPLQVASVIQTLLAAATAAAARTAIGALGIAGDTMTGALGINRSGGAVNATDLHAGGGNYTIDGAVSVRYEPVIAAPGNYARTQWFHPTYTGNVGQNAIALQVVPELAAGKTCPAMYGVAVTHINAAAAGKFVGVWVYAAGGVAPTTNYDAIFDGGGNVGVGTAAPTARLHVAGTVKADTSLAIGGGTALTKIVVYTPTLTPANVAGGASSEEAFTVTGLTTGDTIVVAVPGVAAGVGLVGARVSAANTLALTFGNFTSGPLAPPAGVYRILAVRS